MDDPAETSTFAEGSPNRLKQIEMFACTDAAYQLAKKYKVKTAFGTDILFSASAALAQGKELVRLKKWYSPAEALIMAISQNAELLTLSGPRNPYSGKLSVVEERAYADLLLVDGDPLSNLDLVADPEKNFLVIMKDGKFYENLIKQSVIRDRRLGLSFFFEKSVAAFCPIMRKPDDANGHAGWN